MSAVSIPGAMDLIAFALWCFLVGLASATSRAIAAILLVAAAATVVQAFTWARGARVGSVRAGRLRGKKRGEAE